MFNRKYHGQAVIIQKDYPVPEGYELVDLKKTTYAIGDMVLVKSQRNQDKHEWRLIESRTFNEFLLDVKHPDGSILIARKISSSRMAPSGTPS